jgi:hypothetical protein
MWTRVSFADNRDAFGIWGSSPSNVWFAGVNYWAYWDGQNLVPRADGGGAGTRIWGTAPRDLWVLDGVLPPFPDGTSRIRHLNAGTDTSFDVPALFGSGALALAGLWAYDDAHVWAVGGGGAIVFYDGASWSRAASGTERDLAAVWGSAPSDVWSVGAAGTILHWNGASWAPVESPTRADLRAIWGSSPSNVWAVGGQGTVLRL